MEILLAIAGIAGLAALLSQSKPLPSEADFNKAMDKWNKDPKDPEANLVIGKYVTFMQGDYKLGMIFLSNSSDSTLKILGDHEIIPEFTDTATKKVAMGDEWVAAAKKFPALSRIFYDRGAQWYIEAWPNLDAAWKAKVREQGKKLAVPRPPGPQRKEFPSGWALDTGAESKSAEIDHTVSHLGSYSIKLPPSKNPGTYNAFNSVLTPISGDVIEVTAYVRSEGTENGEDTFRLYLTNENGPVVVQKALVPVDLPVWKKITISSSIPKTANRAHFFAAIFSKKGNLWVDDVSIKVDGKEILKNGSFEEK